MKRDERIRDFDNEPLEELCAGISADDFSRNHVKRNAAYSSSGRTEGDQVGRLKQTQTAQGIKRVGGGWKKMKMVKPVKTGNRGDAA